MGAAGGRVGGWMVVGQGEMRQGCCIEGASVAMPTTEIKQRHATLMHAAHPRCSCQCPVAGPGTRPSSCASHMPAYTHTRTLPHPRRLSQDPVAYGQYLAWKQLPFSQQVPGFQRYMAQAEVVQGKSPQCRLCNLLMERRLQPGLLKQRPTCAGNGTWGKRAGGSSWGEGAAALADAQKAWQAAVGP